MGIFSNFFKRSGKEKRDAKQYIKMLSGEVPIYSQFGNNIFASDVVEQALYSIVSEISKCRIQVTHEDSNSFDVYPVNNDINSVLHNPNNLMTQSEFLEQIAGLLLKNYNAFIYIERRNSVVTALYPLRPQQVTFLEGKNDEVYVEFSFMSGYKAVLNYGDIIHIRTHYFNDDFMGGGSDGNPDFKALLKVLKVENVLMQSLDKNVQAGLALNGIVKYGTLASEDELKDRIADFEKQLQDNKSGILALDMKSEFTPIGRNIQAIDNNVLSFIDDKILRYFGVSLAIVRGDFTPEQYRAFYQKALEPLIIKISQALTKKLCRENNKVMLYPKELVFLSPSETREVINLLMQSGGVFENEKRVAFGMMPLEELKGVRMQSLNYVNVEYAKEYQLNAKKVQKEVQKDEI